MARVRYIKKEFRDEKAALVPHIQRVFDEYAAQGYLLNARGIAYRLEGQGIIRKTEDSFQQVETVVKEGRLMGLFDWDGLPVDSARALREYAMWKDPAHRLRSAANNHLTDKWNRQQNRVEVWTEKEGLLGIIQGACENEDVPYRALTGYDAIAALRQGAHRSLNRNWLGRVLLRYQDTYGNGMISATSILKYLRMEEEDLTDDEKVRKLWSRLKTWEAEEKDKELPTQHLVVLYIGDHDPSGCNITDKVREELALYGAWDFTVERIAITCEETCQSDDPELHSAPAKVTDARHRGYVIEHGSEEAWEVESLEPSVLSQRVTDAIDQWRDPDAWEEAVDDEEAQRALLTRCAIRWEDVAAFLAQDDE